MLIILTLNLSKMAQSQEILAEKITDYFEKVELKNNKKFEKCRILF